MPRQPILISNEGLTCPVEAEPNSISSLIDEASETAAEIYQTVRHNKGKIAALAMTAIMTANAATISDHADSAFTSVETATEHTLELNINQKSNKFLPGVAVGAGGTLGSIAAIYGLGHWLGGWKFPWNIGDVNFGGAKPLESIASVRPETEMTEEVMDMTCVSQVGIGVGVESFKENSWYENDAKIDKLIFTDFLLCGDEGELSTTLHIETNQKTGEITRVSGVIPPLKPTHPRVDFTDIRNCLKAKSDISLEDLQKKIDEWNKKKNEGKNPGCDDGFAPDGIGIGMPESNTNMISTGYTLAQLAVAFDADGTKAIEEQWDNYEKLIRERVMGRYQITEDQLSLTRPVQKMDRILDMRLSRIKKELDTSFKSWEIVRNEAGNPTELRIVGYGGEHLSVILTGDLKNATTTEVEEPEITFETIGD